VDRARADTLLHCDARVQPRLPSRFRPQLRRGRIYGQGDGGTQNAEPRRKRFTACMAGPDALTLTKRDMRAAMPGCFILAFLFSRVFRGRLTPRG
jgi:hypothetical protein